MLKALQRPQTTDLVQSFFEFVETHRFPVSAAIALLVAVTMGSQYRQHWLPDSTAIEIEFGIVATSMPLVASSLHAIMRSLRSAVEGLLDMSPDVTHEWFDGEMSRTFYSGWPLMTGLLLAVASTLAIGFSNPWEGSARYLTFLVLELGLFLIGFVGYLYIRILVFLYALSCEDARVGFTSWPEPEFLLVNEAYLKMFYLGVLEYLIAIVAVWSSPGGSYFIVTGPVAYTWTFPATASVIAFFIASQYLLHRIMARAKQRRLHHWNGLLDTKFAAWAAEPSDERSRQVSDVLAWRDRVRQESEWPLNFQSAAAVVSGLLLPAVPALKTTLDLLHH